MTRAWRVMLREVPMAEKAATITYQWGGDKVRQCGFGKDGNESEINLVS
jgi:hypothetical protein